MRERKGKICNKRDRKKREIEKRERKERGKIELIIFNDSP